jgi:L-fuculose-phosphate aldolase
MYSDEQIRQDVLLAARGLADYGCGDLIGGHVSIRVPGEEAFWCNAFDRALVEIQPEDVVKVGFDGTVLSSDRYVSVGLGFHAGIYQLRPDVNAIVHTHGHWITAQAAFARPPKCWHNLATFFVDDCAMSPDDSLDSIAPALGDKSTILIPWHGAITVAPGIARAAGLHQTLEYICRLDVTLSATDASPMPESMIPGMRDLVESVGYLDEAWKHIQRRGRRALAQEGVFLPEQESVGVAR